MTCSLKKNLYLRQKIPVLAAVLLKQGNLWICQYQFAIKNTFLKNSFWWLLLTFLDKLFLIVMIQMTCEKNIEIEQHFCQNSRSSSATYWFNLLMYDVPKRPDTIGLIIKGLKHPKKFHSMKSQLKTYLRRLAMRN